MNYTKGFENQLNILSKDEELKKIVYTTLSSYNGYFHVMFIYELSIKDVDIKKLYINACNNNQDQFLLTLNMIEIGIFKLSDITYNLNLDNPISLVSDINEETLSPKFYNHLDKHKDYCLLQHEIFKEKLNNIKPSKSK